MLRENRTRMILWIDWCRRFLTKGQKNCSSNAGKDSWTFGEDGGGVLKPTHPIIGAVFQATSLSNGQLVSKIHGTPHFARKTRPLYVVGSSKHSWDVYEYCYGRTAGHHLVLVTFCCKLTTSLYEISHPSQNLRCLHVLRWDNSYLSPVTISQVQELQ